MSRIGKKPVTVPAGVKVSLNPGERRIEVSGPKGTQSIIHRPEVTVTWDESEKRIVASIPEAKLDDGQTRAYWGLTRSLIANMIVGVTQGYSRKLEIVGVGWQGKLAGKTLTLNVGYADPVVLTVPDGVTCEIANNTQITISGPDKQLVGQFAAMIRAQRKPEPYNGKGIKYSDEVIQKKQGKAFGS